MASGHCFFVADAFALNFARVFAFLKGRLGMVLNIFGEVFGRVWGMYLEGIWKVFGGHGDIGIRGGDYWQVWSKKSIYI